jgi:hypothetical protein
MVLRVTASSGRNCAARQSRRRCSSGIAARPFRSGTAQQLEQQRLGLVVLLVRGQQEVCVDSGKNAQARASRSGFDARRIVARDFYAMDRQFDSMRRTQTRAEIGPVVGARRKAVVHVHGFKFEGMLIAQRYQRIQQDHRIESARQGQRQPRTRRNMAGQHVRHDFGKRLTWQEFP